MTSPDNLPVLFPVGWLEKALPQMSPPWAVSVLTSAKAADQMSLAGVEAWVSLLNAAHASDEGVDLATNQQQKLAYKPPKT